MAAPMGQGRWEPILEPIDCCGIAFVILFGKTDDCEGNKNGVKKKEKKRTYQEGGIFLFLWLFYFYKEKRSKDQRGEKNWLSKSI